MIAQATLEVNLSYLLENGCDTVPTLWRTDEGEHGPFLVRQSPARLVMLSDQATRAIFCQRARKEGVNMDKATRGLDAYTLAFSMGNLFCTA